MRISDWSSDVCSSDLPFLRRQLQTRPTVAPAARATYRWCSGDSGGAISVKILVLGAPGMLGNASVRVIAEGGAHSVVAVSRACGAATPFSFDVRVHFRAGFDAGYPGSLTRKRAREETG